MEEKYLTRIEFYRLLLNSNKRLAALYASKEGATVEHEQMAKLVLETSDRTIATLRPYPVLKPQGRYASIINIDAQNAPDSVFGGGYSAALPEIPVRSAGFSKLLNFNPSSGMFEPGEFSDTLNHVWKHVDAMPANATTGIEANATTGRGVVYTTTELTALGQVTQTSLSVRATPSYRASSTVRLTAVYSAAATSRPYWATPTSSLAHHQQNHDTLDCYRRPFSVKK